MRSPLLSSTSPDEYGDELCETIDERFELVTQFTGNFHISITIHYCLSWIYTFCTWLKQALIIPDLLSLHHSSSTGFQRQTFSLSLGSRTVPVPQSQQLLTHSEINRNSTPNLQYSNVQLNYSSCSAAEPPSPFVLLTKRTKQKTLLIHFFCGDA
jgi:hypothetical protein